MVPAIDGFSRRTGDRPRTLAWFVYRHGNRGPVAPFLTKDEPAVLEVARLWLVLPQPFACGLGRLVGGLEDLLDGPIPCKERSTCPRGLPLMPRRGAARRRQ